MHFGAALRLLRAASGVSQRGLATELGVSPAWLSRVEHGHDAPPTPDRLIAIAQALRVPAETLLELVDELRADSLTWLGRTGAGRRLAAELRRRELSAAQLARVAAFVEREFPLVDARATVASLLATERVLLDVVVAGLRDALEVAALRLSVDARAVLDELVTREEQGVSTVGGGLWIPHATGPRRAPTACLLVLRAPLDLPTPDGLPVRAVLALAGLGADGVRFACLAAAARLGETSLIDALGAAEGPEDALRRLALYEQTGLLTGVTST